MSRLPDSLGAVTTTNAGAGRPRSEAAREAVLHAVDDLLVEQGYAAMSLKGIAERAGVSRQTIYRWWSTKAEILFEASWIDAAGELQIESTGSPTSQIAAYLEALVGFLVHSPAGAAYRALLGEAQHDADVARLIASKDILGESAANVIERAVGGAALPVPITAASAELVGPAFYWILSGRDPGLLDTRVLAKRFLSGLKRSRTGT